MNKSLANVQRIVLHGSVWEESRHLVLGFPKGCRPPGFLQALKKAGLWPTGAVLDKKPSVQISLGFSRRGLEHAFVPSYILALFAMKAPAFMAGAALRASSQLGARGSDAPASWDDTFGFMTLDAVLSIHANETKDFEAKVCELKDAAKEHGVLVSEDLPVGRRLPVPPGVAEPLWQAKQARDSKAQWAHFGYRDGLARMGIEGWTENETLAACKPSSKHPAGEFLLGQPQHGGANPWIAGPGNRVWPEEIRLFFANGSFGVLHQVEQHVEEFECFVIDKAQLLRITPNDLKAKLCGRDPNGLPLAAFTFARPEADFDYENDRDGYACPFGSHVRRMNPRSDSLAHSGRQRPLLRRGMPYGRSWDGKPYVIEPRGLLGHFFCASIEDQFEHLIGQWADRVPLGSEDTGHARDPLIGAHECDDGAFVIESNRQLGLEPQRLDGLRPFTRTRGTAYLFYPSLHTLEGIANNSLWRPSADDEEDA
jgi:hypothetical protein